jgi:hypothetical protein
MVAPECNICFNRRAKCRNSGGQENEHAIAPKLMFKENTTACLPAVVKLIPSFGAKSLKVEGRNRCEYNDFKSQAFAE